MQPEKDPSRTPPPKAPLPKILQTEVKVEDLFFYQKSEVVYALTFHFVKHFLPLSGDRTTDQMVQAARSGKQNIVEGLSDGVTSTELQLKLLNVARSSFKELRADYDDFLLTRHLEKWDFSHSRYDDMLHFCRSHNKVADYEPFFKKWNAEELCNIALTLLHMIDKMMKSFLGMLEQQFVTQGGIKERMHAARTGYRKEQDEELNHLRNENKSQRQQILILKQQVEQLLNEKRRLEVLLLQAKGNYNN